MGMLEYQGQTVRAADFLANDRTLLAYIRTSLSLLAFGFVIARFELFMKLLPASSFVSHLPNGHASQALGFGFAVLGCILGIQGMWSYILTHKHLRQGTYRPSIMSGLIAASATILLAAGVLLALLRLF